jgi:hypothetical protein
MKSGATVPWYVIPFDDQGRCKAPVTRADLIQALRSGVFSHVFLFSHGWNNSWADAVDRYENFLDGFRAMSERHGVTASAAYRPLLAGIFWPGISLVLPWERAPQIAAGGAAAAAWHADRFADEHDRSVTAIASELRQDQVPRFYALASASQLNDAQAQELAALILPLLPASDEGGGEPLGAADLVAAWTLAEAESTSLAGSAFDADEEAFGTAAPVAAAAPQAAGVLGVLDPRNALRMATVWKMKDRAGTVGVAGVHELVQDMLSASAGSVHVVGHSYGARVMLSALAAGTLPRPVTSALLLQPAVSYLCFAVDADGEGHPGGYRSVLDRVKQPIAATFSSRDIALARIFHLAVRRKSDIGEQRIAAGPPSRFAALGGYGAGGLAAGEGRQADAHAEGDTYAEPGMAGVRVLSIQGSQTISGHGDISNPTTWWMLCDQVLRG